MNFEAEKRKIQNLNKTELNSYEAENKRLLAAARKKIEEARAEKNSSLEKSFCIPGKPNKALINEVMALSEEHRLKDLEKEIQKRKLNFLTPQERKAREQRRKALIRRIEVLMAS